MNIGRREERREKKKKKKERRENNVEEKGNENKSGKQKKNGRERDSQWVEVSLQDLVIVYGNSMTCHAIRYYYYIFTHIIYDTTIKNVRMSREECRKRKV